MIANLIAQTEALAFGRTAPDGQPYRDFPGNRPTTTILAPELTPSVLGQLVALYEHIVFVQGCVWGIDSSTNGASSSARNWPTSSPRS